MPQNRASDHTLIADTATNKEAIANMKQDIVELKDDVHELRSEMDSMREEQRQGHAAIIARLDASQNQILGASKFAKVLWFAFPTACTAIGYIYAKLT